MGQQTSCHPNKGQLSMNTQEGADVEPTEVSSDVPAWNHECDWTAEADAEAALHNHLGSCRKNPGHKNFIPIGQFTTDHLPESCRDEDIVEWTKLIATLTVKVCVRYISEDRPETFPDTDLGKGIPGFKDMVGEPFPFSDYRGKDVLRTGTAWVRHVQSFREQCLCEVTCSHKNWGRVLICTARHVVYNDSEAKNTELTFHYDSEDHLGMTRVERGEEVLFCSTEEDWCLLAFISHDVEFLERLKQTLERMEALWEKLDVKYSTRSWHSRHESHHRPSFPVIVVSHPHGCPKMVTVGECTQVHEGVEDTDKFRHVVYNYTTNTCPGSSGAPVFFVDRRWTWKRRWAGLLRNVLHSACLEGKVNRSMAAFWNWD